MFFVRGAFRCFLLLLFYFGVYDDGEFLHHIGGQEVQESLENDEVFVDVDLMLEHRCFLGAAGEQALNIPRAKIIQVVMKFQILKHA